MSRRVPRANRMGEKKRPRRGERERPIDTVVWVQVSVVDSAEMTPEQRIKRLEDKSEESRERIAKIEVQLTVPKKGPGPILIVFLTSVGIGILAFWGWIGVEVVNHGKKLAEIYALLAPERLKQVSENPTNSENIREASQILNVAKERKVRIDPELVANTGKQFISAAQKNPAAWTAANDFLNYRSFLNVSLVPIPTDLRPANDLDYKFSVNHKPSHVSTTWEKLFTIWLAGNSSGPESARLESLSEPNRSGSGAQLMVLDVVSGAIVLDDEWMKNVVVRNAVVLYSGSRVRLQNVYFVNCSFQLQKTPNGIGLSDKILSATAVDFATTSMVGSNRNLGDAPHLVSYFGHLSKNGKRVGF